jgi:hypothetical protein
MLTLVLLQALAQADAGVPAWNALVGDDAQGEVVLAALVSPAPGGKGTRVLLTLPGGAQRTTDYADDDRVALVADLRAALDQGPATLFVLTLDTSLTLENGKVALSAVQAHTAKVELRFAGPTRVKGQPMPEVLQLVKFAPPAPPLSQQQLRAVFQGAYGEVRSCYQRQLEANALQGKLIVELDVVVDGSVADARLKASELDNIDVERCVMGVVRALRFPRPRGAPLVKVVWPFLFKKGADKPPLPPIRK